MSNLLSTITELIESKREGDFWDFKTEHHNNKAELLHDVICMANSLCKGDRYIIYGVSDKTYELIGATQGNVRRTQSDIIDFLRQQKFAGGHIPNIELKTVMVNDIEIDALIIKDLTYTPYYITEDKTEDKNGHRKTVRANYIYSRNGDSNTPMDKSTDIFTIECLWKKRFGLLLEPVDRFKMLLNDISQWDFDLGNRKYGFHKQFPEFTVQFKECEEGYEPYCAFYLNPTMHHGKMSLCYNTTVLYETEYWTADEFRLYLPKAKISHIQGVNGKNYWYYNYELDNIEGKLLKHFIGYDYSFFPRGTIQVHPFLLFENKTEHESFNNFLRINKNKIELIDIKDYDWAFSIDNELGGREFSAESIAKMSYMYKLWKTTMVEK